MAKKLYKKVLDITKRNLFFNKHGEYPEDNKDNAEIDKKEEVRGKVDKLTLEGLH